MPLLAAKGGGSSSAMVPGAASPQNPPSAGCSLDLSAKWDAPFAEGLLSSAISSSSVQQSPTESTVGLLSQWNMRWRSRLLSCLALAVFCIFSNTVIPQTRGKRFKAGHFEGVLQRDECFQPP